MSAYKEPLTIMVFSSPKELRKWADKIEETYPKLLPGDNTFVDFIHCSKELVIKLHIDQDAMGEEFKK